MGRAVSNKFGCKSVNDKMDGFIVESVVQVGNGSASGIITDDSETLGLDNFEVELVEGTYRTPDRGRIDRMSNL
jgi:hypothetical protein